MEGGPYLISALFCLEIIKEQGIYSLKYLVNEFTQGGNRPTPVDRAPLNLYIRFARGSFVGALPFAIDIIRPDETIVPLPMGDLLFAEGQMALGYDIDVAAQINQPGVYWYVIFLGGREMTRTSFRVRHRPSS